MRVEEIRQSARIVEQCLRELPDGPVDVDDPRLRWPAKGKVFNRDGGADRPVQAGHRGHAAAGGRGLLRRSRAANGELGFYLVSDGSGKPYKCRAARPSFSQHAALRDMIQGALLADVVPTFDMINMIGGECDR